MVEGRDIGTVVAPDADLKVYLTAYGQRAGPPAQRRTRRRPAHRPPPTWNGATASTRPARPTRWPRRRDAVVLDSTELGVDEVVRRLVALVRERRGG